MRKINYDTNRYYLNREHIADLGKARQVDIGVATDMWRSENPVAEELRAQDSEEYLAFCEAFRNLKGKLGKFLHGDYRKAEVENE